MLLVVVLIAQQLAAATGSPLEVPEPSTATFLLIGAGMVALSRLRPSSKKK
jgi:hypothetical protein